MMIGTAVAFALVWKEMDLSLLECVMETLDALIDVGGCSSRVPHVERFESMDERSKCEHIALFLHPGVWCLAYPALLDLINGGVANFE